MTILTIGAITTDVLMRVARLAGADEEVPVTDATIFEGGSAANTAVGVRRLGVASGFLGCVGADADGDRHLDRLEAEGVETSRIIRSPGGRPTTRVLIFVDPSGARQMYFHGGASEELTPDLLTAETLEGVDVVHICTLGPEFAERLIEVRRLLGRSLLLSLDPGCVGIEGTRADRVRALLPRVDVLFVNGVEFARLFDGTTPDRVGAIPSDTLPGQLAIKLGERGAYSYPRNGPLTFHPPVPVAALDSTGAGDAFAAAYLVGMHRGYPPDRLGRFANAVGAHATMAYGCRAALPTHDQALRLLRDQGDDTAW